MPIPLSQPPKKPTNWWRTVPGQFSILVMAGGALLILFELTGMVNIRP